MFKSRFFLARYFAARYFGRAGEIVVVQPKARIRTVNVGIQPSAAVFQLRRSGAGVTVRVKDPATTTRTP